MVEECSGVGRGEGVGEAVARLDRRLRQAGNAVHGVGQADPVPMHGRVFPKPVFDPHPEGLALRDAQRRTGRGAVVGVDVGRGAPLAEQSHAGGPDGQA